MGAPGRYSLISAIAKASDATPAQAAKAVRNGKRKSGIDGTDVIEAS